MPNGSPTPPPGRAPASRLPWLAACAGLVCLYLLRLGYPFADPDLFGYLAFARLWDQTGVFPRTDPFAYVPTRSAWVYHEWLTGVLYYAVVKAFGLAGLKLFKYVLGLGAALVLARTARLRGAPWPAVFLALVLISPVFSFGYASLRAQALTNLCFACCLYLLERARRDGGTWPLWLLAPLFLFWGNAHGGFAAGAGLVAVYAAVMAIRAKRAERRLPWLCAPLAALAPVVLNPYGPDYGVYLVRALAMPRPEIAEWFSAAKAIGLGFQTGNTLSFFLAVAVCLAFFLPRPPWRDPAFWVLAATAAMGLMHLRHQTFFFFSCGAYLPWRLGAFWSWLSRRRPDVAERWERLAPSLGLVTGTLMVLFFGGAFVMDAPLVLRPATAAEVDPAMVEYQPVEAVAFMKKAGLSGNLAPEFTWGEYLMWTMYPEVRVAFDGRYETVYPDGYAETYFAFLDDLPKGRDFLAAYAPDMLLLRPFSPAHLALKNAAGGRDWREAYRDAGAVLLVRRGSAPDDRLVALAGDEGKGARATGPAPPVSVQKDAP